MASVQAVPAAATRARVLIVALAMLGWCGAAMHGGGGIVSGIVRIGYLKTSINGLGLLLVFIVIGLLLVGLGRAGAKA